MLSCFEKGKFGYSCVAVIDKPPGIGGPAHAPPGLDPLLSVDQVIITEQEEPLEGTSQRNYKKAGSDIERTLDRSQRPEQKGQQWCRRRCYDVPSSYL